MISVLIVIAWINGSASGPTVSMQEFTTLDKCEAAKKELERQGAGWFSGDRLRTFCVPK